jgi:hypothetical protein
MNTTGKPLTRTEVFHALHSGLAGSGPADLHSVGRVPAELGFGALDDRLALRCVLAFRGGDVFREDFRDEFSSDADRSETFREVASVLREVVEFLRGDAGMPHSRLLPYSHVVPILVRFTRIHGSPRGRSATLLRRWVWRGAVAGTHRRGVSVVSVRSQVSAIDAADAVEAAANLLRQIPPFPDFAVELNQLHFGHAMTKINVLGLLSAEPRDLLTSQPIDVSRLLDGHNFLRKLANNASLPNTDTIANRVVATSGSGRTLQQALVAAGTDVAASHLVDSDGQRLLRNGLIKEFLARRAQAAGARIKAHVDDMAEWGARDGRSVADVIRTVA